VIINYDEHRVYNLYCYITGGQMNTI